MEVTDAAAAADHMRQMKNDILFYKRAYEDTSQNALWQYMLEYFVDAYTAAAKRILRTDFWIRSSPTVSVFTVMVPLE